MLFKALATVSRDPRNFVKLMSYVAERGDYDFTVTDATDGVRGSSERMAFICDKRKVRFGNVAGGIVLPQSSSLPEGKQFARTPFVTSLQISDQLPLWVELKTDSTEDYLESLKLDRKPLAIIEDDD